MNQVTLSISGMSCGTCATKLEKAVLALQGVRSVSASHALAQAVVRYDSNLTEPSSIKEAVAQLGYGVAEARADVETSIWQAKGARIALVVITGLLIGTGWVLRPFAWAPPWVVHLAAGVALLLGGYPIVAKALRAALRWDLSVDALVVIAATAAVITGNYLEAGLVVFILLLGELLEEITIAKTGRAIRDLASLLPDRVRVKRGEIEVEIPCSEIEVGDVIVVRSGERIAVDGVIRSVMATLDQSLVTGESLPVEKVAGDEVYSGSINQVGAVEIRATQVGQDTTVSRIRNMIVEAQETRAQVQRLVDRFANYFVPAMLVIALAVYLITGDIQRAITILVVACPCALVLGTPTAVVAAIGAAARRGIVIRGGDILETLGKVSGVVFDKTGTLTRGSPQVTEIKSICGHSEKDILRLAAIAEKLSEHPLASAVLRQVAQWQAAIPSPNRFQVKPGRGVEAEHDGIRILLGNRRLLSENGLSLSPELETQVEERERCGATVLILAHDREVCGLLTLADPVRKDAAAALDALRASARPRLIAMYTGDNHRTAAFIAEALGIKEVAAGLLPEEKVNRIKVLRSAGHTIAMVGDGINDAPALATADVGIAMGVVGSDIATNAAQVVLLSENLSHVPAVIALGRKALSVIRQNLVFAVFFNTTMILMASGGIVCMVTGALCHQASSLLVILNSMRLLLGVTHKPTPGRP